MLLRADSEHALPYSYPEVIKALASYKAVFKETRKDAQARLELLAGLMWRHAHQLNDSINLHATWSASLEAQPHYITVARCPAYRRTA